MSDLFPSNVKKPNSLNRIILTLEDTPSLVVEDRRQLSVNTEISSLKSYLRVQGYWIDAMIEQVLKIEFVRGQTRFQGARAGQGWQSAHYHLAPAVTDNMAHQVINSVVEKGLTPTRSYPYLRHRANLVSPDAKILQANRENGTFVEDFIVSRLPVRGLETSLSETAYEKHRNATFDCLAASNQFDSLLEAKIAPELERLKHARKVEEVVGSKKVDADESVSQLVSWMDAFYHAAIKHNGEYLLLIDEFFKVQSEMTKTEDKYRQKKDISDQEITKYIQDVVKILELKNQLCIPPAGVSRSVAIERVRNDFAELQTLSYLAIMSDPLRKRNAFFAFLNGVQEHTKTDIALIRSKYKVFQQEAAAQLEGIKIYQEPCAIGELKTLIFGVVEEGERKPPTDEQLKAQIYEILKPEEKSSKMHLKRGSSTEDSENQLNDKKRRLNEENGRALKEKARRSLTFANEQL